LSILAGYTLSKSEDNGSGIRTLDGDTLFPQNSFCLDCEWGLSVFDVRHRFVASILYELPFGDGKPYAQTGIGAAILGGWQISTILNKASGFPRTAYVGTDQSNTGGGQDRPNTTGLDRFCPATSRRSRGGSTPMPTWCSRAAPSATPAAIRSSARASPTWMRRSSGTSG